MKTQAFRAVAGVIAIYHILLGLAGLVLPTGRVTEVIDLAFGVTLELGDALGLVARFTSVYVLVFGLMMLLVCLRPKKYRAFVWIALVLFGVRLANRIVHFAALNEMGMASTRNIVGTALIGFFFAALLWALPKRDTDSAH